MLAIVSYEDEAGAYPMRAYNHGRYLETELKLLEDGGSLTWGFSLGDIRTGSVLRIDEKGEWTELAEIRAAAGRRDPLPGFLLGGS